MRVVGMDGSRGGGAGNDYVQDVPVESIVFNRLAPRQVGTGIARGTQTTFNDDGSKIVTGKIPDTQDFGIAFYDSTGEIIAKYVGPTRYVYNPSTDKNVMQDGKLPDGSYGWAVAKTGYDVEDIF